MYVYIHLNNTFIIYCLAAMVAEAEVMDDDNNMFYNKCYFFQHNLWWFLILVVIQGISGI